MFDFPSNTKEKLAVDQHENWVQYILPFQEYKLYIQMPNKSEETVELFVNEGKKELLGGVVLQPSQFSQLIDLIENGGIYIQERKGLFGLKKNVYMQGINMPMDIQMDTVHKVY